MSDFWTAVTRASILVAVMTLGAAVAVAAIVATSSSRTSQRPAVIVHVVHPAGGAPARIVDGSARALFLRGVAVTGLVDYASDYQENPPVSEADFDEISALGFDYVRLPVSWSLLEPRPGGYDRAYLGLISRAVRWAWSKGLYVVIDMHIDRYNKELAPGDEADGAPDWATLTPSTPCVPKLPSIDCIRDAWQSFWTDHSVGGEGLQEHYIGALVALSTRLQADPGLAGIELMNNPSTGYTPSPSFEQTELWPFWRRAIAALRAAGERLPLWLDRTASAEQLDVDPAAATLDLLARLELGDGQLVYAPHDYAGVFSAERWPQAGRQLVSQWYATAEQDAATLAMPLEVGEWGNQAGGAWEQLIAAKLDLQDSAVVGSAYWMWKQRPGFYDWPIVQAGGDLRTDSNRAQALSRPHPDAVPGAIASTSFDGARLVVRVYGRGGIGTFWSGTQVLAGGPSLLARPLTHVTIDGRPVRNTQQLRAYRTADVWLRGYVVGVRVPAGSHTIVLS